MKTIKFQNVKIIEMTLSKIKGEYVLSVAYSLLDEDSKEWGTKRITLKDFTLAQKNKLAGVFTTINNKLKTFEKI